MSSFDHGTLFSSSCTVIFETAAARLTRLISKHPTAILSLSHRPNESDCNMLTNVRHCRRQFLGAVRDLIKCWLKPNTLSSAVGAAADLTRSKADLIAENALLRQQFIILQHQSKRPHQTSLARSRHPFLEACPAHRPTRYDSALALGSVPHHLAAQVQTQVTVTENYR